MAGLADGIKNGKSTMQALPAIFCLKGNSKHSIQMFVLGGLPDPMGISIRVN